MKRERTSWQESKGAGGETDYLYYMCAKSQTVNSTTYADRLHLEMDQFKAIWANRGHPPLACRSRNYTEYHSRCWCRHNRQGIGGHITGHTLEETHKERLMMCKI